METETTRLSDLNIKHGLKTDMGDDFSSVLEKVFLSDIIVFATPIWWGSPSSLIQKFIERMHETDNEYMVTGKSRLYHKVSGIVVTGHEDGAQNVIGVLANALTWYGFVLPPECAAYWVGESGIMPMDQDSEKIKNSQSALMMADKLAENLYNYASLIKSNKDKL